MWICPKCERRFKNNHQSHYCVEVTIDELLDGRADELLLAFDKILLEVFEFGDVGVGTSKNTIIFTSVKAFLIIKPMTKVLDLKFYTDKELHHSIIHTSGKYGNKHYYHLRIKEQDDINPEVIKLLWEGYSYSLK